MTEADIQAAQSGLTLRLNIDLSRELSDRDSYYQLTTKADALNDAAVKHLLERLAEAITIRIDDEALALDWQFNKFHPAALSRADYLNPLVWPMTTINAAAAWPNESRSGGLSVQFTSAFIFEEPISVTLTNGSSRLSRWLVTQQISPALALGELTPRASGGLQNSERWHYLGFGLSHIIPKGFDHILFILLLCLTASGLRQSLGQLSLFTLAHSITLVIATLGIVRAPSAIVEPLIALSILAMALAFNLRRHRSPSRYGLIFGFGLMHGLGFAAALQGQTLPQYGAIETLILFNLGIELAQLLVALAYLAAFETCIRLTKNAAALQYSIAWLAIGWSLVLLASALVNSF